jgi:hypothetical protein
MASALRGYVKIDKLAQKAGFGPANGGFCGDTPLQITTDTAWFFCEPYSQACPDPDDPALKMTQRP